MHTQNNLGTFRILFLVKGILTLLASLLFLGYAFIGYFINDFSEFSENSENIPFNPSIIFAIIGGIGFVITIAFGILTLYASKYLKELKNYNFIFVVAILNCLTGILGILLGVFTLIEINKPEVKELFQKNKLL
ncbi:MAG: hypothetical protein JXQ93_09920 [Flavobacteriaceae bacterium]